MKGATVCLLTFHKLVHYNNICYKKVVEKLTVNICKKHKNACNRSIKYFIFLPRFMITIKENCFYGFFGQIIITNITVVQVPLAAQNFHFYKLSVMAVIRTSYTVYSTIFLLLLQNYLFIYRTHILRALRWPHLCLLCCV